MSLKNCSKKSSGGSFRPGSLEAMEIAPAKAAPRKRPISPTTAQSQANKKAPRREEFPPLSRQSTAEKSAAAATAAPVPTAARPQSSPSAEKCAAQGERPAKAFAALDALLAKIGAQDRLPLAGKRALIDAVAEVRTAVMADIARAAAAAAAAAPAAAPAPESRVQSAESALSKIQATLAENNRALARLERSLRPQAPSKNEVVAELKAASSEARSYSSVVSIVPTTSNSSKSTEEIISVLEAAIDPAAAKLHARVIRSAKGSANILVRGEADAAKLIACNPALEKAGLRATSRGKADPRLIINDVPLAAAVAPAEELLSAIYAQNLDGEVAGLTRASFLARARVVVVLGCRRRDHRRVVIALPKECRAVLMESGRICLGLEALRCRDHFNVVRCYNCHLYGHTKESCKVAKPSCGWCGATAHKSADCTRRDRPARCATCCRMRRGSEAEGHRSGDTSCPAYKAALCKLVANTDG